MRKFGIGISTTKVIPKRAEDKIFSLIPLVDKFAVPK